MVSPLQVGAEFRETLFGGPRLEEGSRSLELSPLQSAFVGIVAAHRPSGIRRERLLPLLWNLGTDATLRRRLSQLVYSLKKRLSHKPLILLVGDSYLLNAELAVSDLESLERALHQGALRAAVNITGGGFLSNLAHFPTPDLERWIQEQKSGLRSDMRDCAATAWREAEQTTDWARAEEAAEVLLHIDPENEWVLRGLLRARALLGRRQEANATFAEFRDDMKIRDSEWTPEEETLLLVSSLASMERADQPPVSGRGSFVDPPMTGREDELHRLLLQFHSTAAEGFSTIQVLGEEGVGKTRLVDAALSQLPLRGFQIVSTACSRLSHRIPLDGFSRMLSCRQVLPVIQAMPDPWRTLLAPFVADLEPASRSPYSTGEGSQLPGVWEAFRLAFEELTRVRPLVLFLDRLEWIDRFSLSLLVYT